MENIYYRELIKGIRAGKHLGREEGWRNPEAPIPKNFAIFTGKTPVLESIFNKRL